MSRFIGGPCDGEEREIYGDPMTVYVPTFSMPSFNPQKLEMPIVDHVYEKRAGGFYYEHVGTRQIWLSGK